MKTQYKSLYEMLDKCQYILANSLEQNLKDLENFAQFDALSEWTRNYKMKKPLKYQTANYNLENQDELEKLAVKYPNKSFDDVWEEMSEELQNEISEAIADSDYPDVYQTFIIDSETFDILKDYGQFVYYNEEIDLHFLGVMHYGTAWSHVMGSVFPIDNKERYKIYN